MSRGDLPTREEVTRLLIAVRQGDRDAMDVLLPLVYNELRILARRQLARRQPGQTINTTALVHEAYLKLADPVAAGWQNRTHFMAVAATAMRQILIDHARRRAAKKRGVWARKVDFEEARLGVVSAQAEELLALDQALIALAEQGGRLSRVVEMRFFAGLSIDEMAEVLGVTDRTVKRDWRAARAFLYHTLTEQAPE